MLELLLAAVMFEAALLAAAPLYVRAAGDVRDAAEGAQAASLAASRLELLAAPDSAASSETGSSFEFFSGDQRRWLPTPPALPDRTLWIASTTVRRYPLNSIEDGRIEPSEGLTDSDWDPADGPPPVRLESVEVALARTVDGHRRLTLERIEWAIE